jgi:hypothetical protein
MAGWAPRAARGIVGLEMRLEEARMRTRIGLMARWIERLLLGTVMVVAARVIERRLLRAVGRRHP